MKIGFRVFLWTCGREERGELRRESGIEVKRCRGEKGEGEGERGEREREGERGKGGERGREGRGGERER